MRALALVPISAVAFWAVGQAVENQSQVDGTPLPAPEKQTAIRASAALDEPATSVRAITAPEPLVPPVMLGRPQKLPVYSVRLPQVPVRLAPAISVRQQSSPLVIPDVANLPWNNIMARALQLPAITPPSTIQSRPAVRPAIVLPATSASRPNPTPSTAVVPAIEWQPLQPAEPLVEPSTNAASTDGAASAALEAIPQTEATPQAEAASPSAGAPAAGATPTMLLAAPAASVAASTPPQVLVADARISQPITARIQTDVVPEAAFAPPQFSANQLPDSAQLTPTVEPITITGAMLPDLAMRRPSSALLPSALANAATVDQTYTLGAGDRLMVGIFNVPEYSGEQQISVDGALNMPLIGRVSVAGMTLEQAGRTLESRYRQQLRNPIVTLTLLSARPLQVSVAGEVRQPGLYTLSLTEESSFPSVVEAIQAAGGTTQAADLRQVEVQRRGSGTTQVISIDLWEVVQNGNASQNLTLRDGDTIVIPPTANVNIAETAQLAASNLTVESTQPHNIAVVGQVVRPGAYSLGGAENSQPTVAQAIQLAGGVKPLANLRQIEVRRPTRSGGEQVITLDFWQLLNTGDLSQDLILQQGDTVMIPTATALTPAEMAELASTNISPTSIQVNVVGEVKSPGSVQVQANTTLNQALLAAGGLNQQAQRTVQLIRINPDGTLTQQQIRVDLTQGINPETNPILFNNDVVIVGQTTSSRILQQLGGVLNTVLQVLPLF